jgi:hypothetical protein
MRLLQSIVVTSATPNTPPIGAAPADVRGDQTDLFSHPAPTGTSRRVTIATAPCLFAPIRPSLPDPLRHRRAPAPRPSSRRGAPPFVARPIDQIDFSDF